jgi:ketosteroid isomerase-like protein
MSKENVEVVARVYEGAAEVERLLLDGGDVASHPWLALWHPECVLEELAEAPDAADYHGRDGVVRYFQRAFQDVWAEWHFTPTEIVEGSDGILAAVNNWGRSKSGAELELRIFQVFRVQDGMIIRASGYLDRKQALRAAGLEE